MTLTKKEKKELNELAEISAFNSFMNMKPELWENSILWKTAQKKLLNNWIIELEEELKQSDEEDKEYMNALLFRVENMFKRVK